GFNYCVFQKDQALCTKGDRPMLNRCNPHECTNSYILPEHVPFHQQNLVELEYFYGNLPEGEKESPVGKFYSQEIVKVRKTLEPFTKQP
ncbi:MAG: hypothetical protein MN733_01275, partial [Nitrososphaera sp.]|nr:hypothetical protein [Nitrososphaera sp.]